MNIDIIGAGINGLSAAYYLSKLNNNIKIRLFELEDSVGGLASTFKTENFIVEKFYHHFFLKDVDIIELIEELELGNSIKWRSANTGTYYSGTAFRLSSPIDLLKFTPITFLERIKMGLMLLKAKRVDDWKKMDDISAKDYILKNCGKNVYDKVWKPLFDGKFGPYADSISAAWLWSKLVDRGSSRRKTGFEELGYLSGGMTKLFNKIVNNLNETGKHEVYLNRPVKSLKINDEGIIEKIRVDEEWLNTDVVISALQLPDLIKLIPDGYKNIKKSLDKIQYLSNICLVLVSNRSVSDFYWTNISDEKTPFIGIIEHTNWADINEFQDKHLLYLSSYVPANDPRNEMNSNELLEMYLPYIKKMFSNFDEKSIEEKYVWKAKYAQPIVTKGYRKLIPNIQSDFDNLFVITMAQIYPNDRQMSNGVKLSKQLTNILKNKYSL